MNELCCCNYRSIIKEVSQRTRGSCCWTLQAWSVTTWITTMRRAPGRCWSTTLLSGRGHGFSDLISAPRSSAGPVVLLGLDSLNWCKFNSNGRERCSRVCRSRMILFVSIVRRVTWVRVCSRLDSAKCYFAPLLQEPSRSVCT